MIRAEELGALAPNSTAAEKRRQKTPMPSTPDFYTIP